MLKVDLGQLHRRGRRSIEAELAAGPLLEAGSAVELSAPIRVTADVQRSGLDTVVRGEARTTARLGCRRCLVPVELPVVAPLTLVYREDMDPAEAEAAEVYAVPPRATEVDLEPAVREHLLLAVPQYALCHEGCRGLCAQCGANRNETDCGCSTTVEDERWAPLKRLRSD